MYYVYELVDPRNNLPFYIGKGTGNRCNDHVNDILNGSKKTKNIYKERKIKKILSLGLTVKVNILSYFNIENDAFIEEKRLILLIGRENLTNLTDGGEGTSGWIQSEDTKTRRKQSMFSEDSIWRKEVTSTSFKEKMSKNTVFRKDEFKKMLSDKYKGSGNPMYGKPQSEETKRKRNESLAKARKEGRWKLSEEGKLKLSQSRKGIKNKNIRKDVKHYVLISPLGDIYHIPGAKRLQEFCKQNSIQVITLKKNIGKEIGENDVYTVKKGKTDKNTIKWKLLIQENTECMV